MSKTVIETARPVVRTVRTVAIATGIEHVRSNGKCSGHSQPQDTDLKRVYISVPAIYVIVQLGLCCFIEFWCNAGKGSRSSWFPGKNRSGKSLDDADAPHSGQARIATY